MIRHLAWIAAGLCSTAIWAALIEEQYWRKRSHGLLSRAWYWLCWAALLSLLFTAIVGVVLHSLALASGDF